jgi:hypothetical protein
MITNANQKFSAIQIEYLRMFLYVFEKVNNIL